MIQYKCNKDKRLITKKFFEKVVNITTYLKLFSKVN